MLGTGAPPSPPPSAGTPTSSWWPAGSSTYTSTSPWPALLVSTVNSARFFTMLPVGSMPAGQGQGAGSRPSGPPPRPCIPPLPFPPLPIRRAPNWVNRFHVNPGPAQPALVPPLHSCRGLGPGLFPSTLTRSAWALVPMFRPGWLISVYRRAAGSSLLNTLHLALVTRGLLAKWPVLSSPGPLLGF